MMNVSPEAIKAEPSFFKTQRYLHQSVMRAKALVVVAGAKGTIHCHAAGISDGPLFT